MSVITLFFIIFLIWIARPIIRGIFLVHRVRKSARQMYEQMYGGASRQPQEPPRRKPGWSSPAPRKKKIDPSVGEYVRFQEIQTTETVDSHTDPATGDTRTTVTVEQQVTDAEWEDLPS